jgi:hypothetical protein
MTWRVEHTIIDEYVPAPREAWHVINDAGEVADDSVTEDQDSAQAMADELNAEENLDSRTGAEIVVNGELVGRGREGMIRALGRMLER